jgi:hypothetical protein
MNQESENKEQRGFFDFSEVWGYYFRKKDPNNKPSINLRLMHGINKIAIIMFLGAVIYLIIKRVFL